MLSIHRQHSERRRRVTVKLPFCVPFVRCGGRQSPRELKSLGQARHIGDVTPRATVTLGTIYPFGVGTDKTQQHLSGLSVMEIPERKGAVRGPHNATDIHRNTR